MRRLLVCCVMALGPALVPLSASGFFPHHSRPHCEPGYTLVEEVCYIDVVRKCCKPVPDVKKTVKWVYDCKTEDFCLTKCPLHGSHRHHDCGQCVECGKVLTKKLLIKKAVVVETPATKCIVETFVEKVPHITYRKVPCAPGCPTPGAIPEPIPAPKSPAPYMPPATSQQTTNPAPMPSAPTPAATTGTVPVVPAPIPLQPGAE